MWSPRYLAGLCTVVAVAPLTAQGPQPASRLTPGLSVPAAWIPAAIGPADTARPRDSLPCPDCHPPKRFWAGFGELMLVQLIPHSVNATLRGAVWADVSIASIRNNLAYPWQWDDNQFLNNQFSHPYHGSLYFNAARTNGYDFWESFAWPFAGSLMWEIAGEAWAPAPNDFLNTSFGGVALGETFYRLSSLALDNTATGSERTWREIGGFVLNPIRGFNRLVRGETHGVSANPPDWRPSKIVGVLDAGYRSTATTYSSLGSESAADQWDLGFSLSYGDPVKDLSGKPFSYFMMTAELAGPAVDSARRLNRLSVRGSLGAWPVGGSGRHQFALSLGYDYYSNPAVEYGGQSVQAGLVSLFGSPGSDFQAQTAVMLNGIIIGATQSDYYRALEGRNYDYGPGAGVTVAGRVLYKRHLDATLAYNGIWTYTVDGAESSHFQNAVRLDARYWLNDRLGLGLGTAFYERQSDYRDQPDVTERASIFRAFVSTAIPRLPQSAAGEQP